VSIVQSVFLIVKFSVEVRILLLSVNEEILLVVDFLSEGLDHVNVNFHSTSVVFLHSSFVIGYSIEVLFKAQKLILKIFIFSFSCSKIHCFLSELGDQSILMILNLTLIHKFSFRAL